jgi:hypothetical protein
LSPALFYMCRHATHHTFDAACRDSLSPLFRRVGRARAASARRRSAGRPAQPGSRALHAAGLGRAPSRLTRRSPKHTRPHALSRFRVGVTLVEWVDTRKAKRICGRESGSACPGPSRVSAITGARRAASTDDAIRELRRAAAAGLFVPPSALKTDAHLGSLSGTAGWGRRARCVRRRGAPVRARSALSRIRLLAWRLGRSAHGQPPTGQPSRNTITSDEDGCVLTEHWESPSGSKGRSIQHLRPVIRCLGGKRGWINRRRASMTTRDRSRTGTWCSVGDTPAPNGQLGRVPTRLTFFRIGKDTVRQFSEISNDQRSHVAGGATT